MQNVSLDAVLHLDLHTAILGWLLTAVQPKLQHLRHTGGKFATSIFDTGGAP
jgi:hypothetical protein